MRWHQMCQSSWSTIWRRYSRRRTPSLWPGAPCWHACACDHPAAKHARAAFHDGSCNYSGACRKPIGDGAGTWGLLEGYLSDGPDSATVTDDLKGMAKAAAVASSAIADIERLEIASTQNLGYLDPKRGR